MLRAISGRGHFGVALEDRMHADLGAESDLRAN